MRIWYNPFAGKSRAVRKTDLPGARLVKAGRIRYNGLRMKPFSLLVKPVGGACNLRCRYCFYSDHAGGRMDPDLFARLLASYAALPFAGKAVALQGGEPLLADPEILAILNRAPVAKSLQTNATLITDEIARDLAANRWLVGASLDGPPELNAARGDVFDATVRGIRRLEAAGVDYNLLTVVSRANVARPVEVYRFLRDNFATRFHQYIECTGPDLAIGGAEWGRFLIGLFDEWIKADAHAVSVRLFDSIVSQLVRGVPTQCSFDETCAQYLVVEHDGSVYPCDFFVTPELRLGNVATHAWEELLASPVYRAFAERKRRDLPSACSACAHFAFCRGDCPRNRRTLCEGWKAFFDHALPRFHRLAAAFG